jgi:hypothetical protein
MSRKSEVPRREFLRAAALCVALLPTAAFCGVCEKVEVDDSFAASDHLKSAYFDDYYIRSEGGVYYIRATKRLTVTMSRATKVLSALESYAQFMPGYKGIRMKRSPDGAIYTAIRFRPDFSFFESRFTNEVEIARLPASYRQCWWQLLQKDPRVMEEYRSPPKLNHGYWRVTPIADGAVELRYFSAIEPPIPIPGFIYRYVVTNSYQEVFEHLVARFGAGRE